MSFIDANRGSLSNINRRIHKKLVPMDDAKKELEALKAKVKKELKFIDDDEDYEDELKELISDIKEALERLDGNESYLPGGKIYQEVEARDRQQLKNLVIFLDKAVEADGDTYQVHEVEFPDIDRQLTVMDWSNLRRKTKFFPGDEKAPEKFEVDFESIEPEKEEAPPKYVPPQKRAKSSKEKEFGTFSREELISEKASAYQKKTFDRVIENIETADSTGIRLTASEVKSFEKLMAAKAILRVVGSKKVAINQETVSKLDREIAKLIDESGFTGEKKPKKKVGFIPSGGGKSFLSTKYPNLFVDIDELPTQYERIILDHYVQQDIKKGDFTRSNRYWNVVVENHQHQIKDRVLLAHHPKQINLVIKADGVSVLTERRNDEKDPIRNKKLSERNIVALINSDYELFYTNSKNLPVFFIWYFRADIFEKLK